ncbi:phage terminase small subunit [Enterococcus casseliflavus]|uniref:phage terminase small subunit n=1 Tax=Enterococcus casseliflavus TaxID=37734 RepID=UPI00201CCEB3|nr:phage terminase small subunit [Enterococcus casseliflavus]MDV7737386.1 phage terminase small subunit [Enterococcus casseliflavus]UQZ98007.1 TerS [Enterococcus casseliflavus]
MARQRNPMRDEAYRIWIDSNKKKPLKDIADELGLSASTVRKWKSEDKWDGETKRSAPNEKERYDSMRGNQNAKGNPGGKPPPDNKNAVSHGLFANWLPDDTRQIIQELYTSEPSDILWNNIMIQYTAIIRSQKIMNVQSEFDHTEDVVSAEVNPMFVDQETGKSVQTKVTRQFQYAWDKQASFLNAQSRAMGTLSNLIKQFVLIADEKDERRQRLELITNQIEKSQLEVRRLKIQTGDLDPEEIVDDGFIDAIKSVATDREVWGDDENIES